jgi:hypothetical protein
MTDQAGFSGSARPTGKAGSIRGASLLQRAETAP